MFKAWEQRFKVNAKIVADDGRRMWNCMRTLKVMVKTYIHINSEKMAYTATVELNEFDKSQCSSYPNSFSIWGKTQKPTSSNPSPLTSTAQISISASLNHRKRESRQTEWKDGSSSIILFPKLPKLPPPGNRFELLSGEIKWVYLGSLWDKDGRFISDTDTVCLYLCHTHIVTLGKTDRLRASAFPLCVLWDYYGLISETKALVLLDLQLKIHKFGDVFICKQIQSLLNPKRESCNTDCKNIEVVPRNFLKGCFEAWS